MKEYRFPIPSAERVMLLVSGIAATAVLPMTWQVVSAAVGATGLSLWDFINEYSEVRLPLAGLLVVWMVSLWAGFSWWLQKSRTVLECGPDRIRYSRPSFGGLPWTACAVEGSPGEVLSLHVGKRMRGLQLSWCLEFRLQRRVLLLNLEHAVLAGELRPTRPKDGAGAVSHPLVTELARCTSQVPRLV